MIAIDAHFKLMVTVHFTASKIFKFLKNYPIGQLGGFPLPSHPRQELSLEEMYRRK